MPCCRGNRLHGLFHISGILVTYHSHFSKSLLCGTNCGGLCSSILGEFIKIPAQVELQVLGLLGKLLTGPWIKLFYTSASEQINHLKGIKCVKFLLEKLKSVEKTPRITLSMDCDLFFGGELPEDQILPKLR